VVTTDEKKQQRANLIIEMEDAQNDFAHERETAFSLAKSLWELSQWLKEHAQQEPSGADFAAGGDLRDTNIRIQGKYRECLDFDRMVRLTESLKKHRQDLYNLESRKQQLNTPTTIRIA